MKRIVDAHGDVLEENDEVMVHTNRDGVRNYERAIVQACHEGEDSPARLCFAEDLQIVHLNGTHTGDCIEKQWDFFGGKVCRDRLIVQLGRLEVIIFGLGLGGHKCGHKIYIAAT